MLPQVPQEQYLETATYRKDYDTTNTAFIINPPRETVEAAYRWDQVL